MTTPLSLWDLYRSLLYDDGDLGLRLDISRMGLGIDTLAGYAERLEAAMNAMEALESGAIANPTEKRQVGHYWLRAPELAPSREHEALIRSTIDRLEGFAASVRLGEIRPPHAARFEQLLIVGIGGSALGPQFVADALGEPAGRLAPRFLDNTDPDGFDRVLGGLGRSLSGTLTIVISKSGGTAETRNGMLEAAAAYQKLGLDFGPHAVAITQEGSKLDRMAQAQGFLARFPMWDWVGGRTSVTSAVGLLPLAIHGVNVRNFLDGAAAMDRCTRTRDAFKNPAALLALAWYHAGGGTGAKAMVVLPYKDRLALLSRYLQQLVMESLGKETDLYGNVVHQGLSVYGNKGSTDQHAFVQQLRDGRPDFFLTFVAVHRDREGASLEVEPGVTSGDFLHGFLLGTREALHAAGRPSLTLTLRSVDPRSVGALIALYERAVGLYASLVGINAYDQPGVEAGKQAAAAVLELQLAVLAALRGRGDAGATCEAIAVEVGAGERVEAVFQILERLAADPWRAVAKPGGDSLFDAVYRIKTT